MKTRNITIIFSFMLFFATSSFGQLATNSSSYTTAVGLRGGETSGLTIKHFMGSQDALEGIIGLWYHGFNATLLYERHSSAFNANGLNWYYGLGGHVSMYGNRRYYYNGRARDYYYSNGSVGLGIDGIFGIEYKIPKAPIAFSLDVKPYVEFISSGGTWTSLDPGLGVKVTF